MASLFQPRLRAFVVALLGFFCLAVSQSRSDVVAYNNDSDHLLHISYEVRNYAGAYNSTYYIEYVTLYPGDWIGLYDDVNNYGEGGNDLWGVEYNLLWDSWEYVGGGSGSGGGGGGGLYYDTNNDGANDMPLISPFMIDINDAETFNFAGYFNYFSNALYPKSWTPDPGMVFGAHAGGGNPFLNEVGTLGPLNSANEYPYKQTSNTSCVISVIRNAHHVFRQHNLWLPPVKSEKEYAASIAYIYGESNHSRFEHQTTVNNELHGVLASRLYSRLNAALNPVGLLVDQSMTSSISNLTDFVALMQEGANMLYAYVIVTNVNDVNNISIGGNHVVLIVPRWVEGHLRIELIDSGPATGNHATVDIYGPNIDEPNDNRDLDSLMRKTIQIPGVPGADYRATMIWRVRLRPYQPE